MDKIEVGVTINPLTNKAYTQDEAVEAKFNSAVQTAANEFISKMLNQDEYEKGIESLAQQVTENTKASAEMKGKIEKMYKALIEQAKDLQERGNNNTGEYTPKVHQNLVKSDLENLNAHLKSGSTKDMILKANYTRAGVTNTTQAMRLPDIGQIGNRRLIAYDLFPRFTVDADSNGVVRYTDWGSVTRGAATVSEAVTIPESTAAFQEYTLNLQKIGDTIPITDEVLRYTNRFEQEIEMFLQTNVDLIVDTQLISGNGTAPNLNGVYTAAGTYTAAASSITDANINDLIVKVSESITSGYGSKYSPDVALMNITDINKLRLKKDTTNNYVIPPFVSADGRNVAGIQVVECNALTANTMLVGDRRFARIYEQDGLLVSTGLQGTQFAQDLITLKVKRYLAMLVRTADVTGWKKVTSISSALTTLAS